MAKTKRPAIGLAVGKSTHTVVMLNADKGTTKMFVANSQAGLESLLSILSERQERKLVMVGNSHWAMPIAHNLTKRGIEVLRCTLSTESTKEDSKVGSIASNLPAILRNPNVPMRPFFNPTKKGEVRTEQLPHSYRLALEYDKKSTELIRATLGIYDLLGILFPEIVPTNKTSIRQNGETIPLPIPEPKAPGLFTQKMRPVLENPNPRVLEKREDIPSAARKLAANSLSRNIPAKTRRETQKRYKQLLAKYDQALKEKEAAIEELKKNIGNHPLAELFNECDSIYVLLSFIGWRNWPKWLEIRRHCGLAVTRVDSWGNPHIDRRRPEIRKYLYLLAILTSKGKEVTQGIRGKPNGKVKRIEKLLKFLWAKGLKEGLTEQ